MALPTMPRYWTSRKNVYEQAIIKQRNHQSDFHERWSKDAEYWNRSNVATNKQNSWESDASLRGSLEKYKADNEKNLKAINLQRRRLLLADMLKQERHEFEAEMKGYSKANYTRLEDMRGRADALRSAREEKRKGLAEEKLYEHWRQNNPDLRQVEQELVKDKVVGSWAGQVDETKARKEQEKKEIERIELEMEEERLAGIDSDRKKEEEKLDEEKRLKRILKEQMDELKDREFEADNLKKQEEELQQEQWRLARIDEERRRVELARQQREHGRVLLRQHKTQMMRRSKQIQAELELDKKILNSLIEQEHELEHIQTARREKAKADAEWMRQVIEDQIRLEKTREAELEMLYQDEAARMWQKRDAEWEREKKARERLMQEVLDDRQQQIELRIEENREQQELSLKHREQLLREMEVANQMTHREQKQAEAQKEAFKLDLKEQMFSRKEREEIARQQEEAEAIREQAENQEYTEFLRQETERMRIRGPTPRQHGRRQAWS
ncbi:trichoplein keratin filament-binding protein-like [Ylistrum balloti]|uniref:trichoplein keratin filament-binding protein-like n=1 Tax=Ylistrum balloti TaxID=509963 RepID=UPI0029058CD6|nr:trichoplein keratin filament-binding protein-like [Ylistrum balloti]